MNWMVSGFKCKQVQEIFPLKHQYLPSRLKHVMTQKDFDTVVKKFSCHCFERGRIAQSGTALAVGWLITLDHDDGDSMFICNVGNYLSVDTVLCCTRTKSASWTENWFHSQCISLYPRVRELFGWTAVVVIKFCYDGHWLYCCELTLLPLSVGVGCSDTVSREVSNMSPKLEDWNCSVCVWVSF